MKVLFNHTPAVVAWALQRIPHAHDFGPCEALGVLDGNRLVAAVVYNNQRDNNIEMSVAAEGRRWLFRAALFAFFDYPFNQLGLGRVTSTIPSGAATKPARKFCQHIGFRYEGSVREHYRDGRDAVIFGMLRRECRWLGEAA